MTQPKARGEAVRAALLAIIRARAVAGLPLPPYRSMATVLGISHPQIARHMAILMDIGAFTTVQRGMHIGIQIEELAA